MEKINIPEPATRPFPQTPTLPHSNSLLLPTLHFHRLDRAHLPAGVAAGAGGRSSRGAAAYGVIGIASTGQCCAHRVQPMHLSVIEYVISALHLPAGQRPARCASYSSRKYRSVDSTGLGAVLPRPQRLPRGRPGQVFELVQIARPCPLPAQSRSRMSSIRRVPTRQKVHLPHDSSWVNCKKVAGDVDHAVGRRPAPPGRPSP